MSVAGIGYGCTTSRLETLFHLTGFLHQRPGASLDNPFSITPGEADKPKPHRNVTSYHFYKRLATVSRKHDSQTSLIYYQGPRYFYEFAIRLPLIKCNNCVPGRKMRPIFPLENGRGRRDDTHKENVLLLHLSARKSLVARGGAQPLVSAHTTLHVHKEIVGRHRASQRNRMISI